jgi:hypothetical protein
MIGKCDAGCGAQAGCFEPGKKLRRAGNPTKGHDRAIDARNHHAAGKTPHGPMPVPSAEFRLQFGIVRRNGDDIGAPRCLHGLAEIAGRQEAIVPIFAIQQQDVHIAVKLAMLETVIEDVHARAADRSWAFASIKSRHLLSQLAGFVTLARDVHRDSRFASNQ